MQGTGDRFDGIEAFLAAAHAASFTAAARAMGLTPSGVAKSVTRLEARVGMKLLHRTTRRITLTPEGETYLAACSRAINELDTAEADLVPKDWVPQGRVHVGLPGAFGRRHVLSGLLDMAARFDKLDLTVSFTERTVDLVQEGHDLSVRIGELGDDANLVARRLGTQRLVICASPAYIERHGAVGGDHRHGPQAGPEGHCRRRGNPRAARPAGARRLRLRPGLPVRQADAGHGI